MQCMTLLRWLTLSAWLIVLNCFQGSSHEELSLLRVLLAGGNIFFIRKLLIVIIAALETMRIVDKIEKNVGLNERLMK